MYLVECKVRFISGIADKLGDLGIQSNDFDEDFLTFDLDDISNFNMSEDETLTSVRFKNGDSFPMLIPYAKMQEVFESRQGKIVRLK